jgi:hypothetical protein
MAVTITCINPQTGAVTTTNSGSIEQGGTGFGQSTIGPAAFGAKRINLSMADVQQTIAEGRARGIKPFNLYNSDVQWESAL